MSIRNRNRKDGLTTAEVLVLADIRAWEISGRPPISAERMILNHDSLYNEMVRRAVVTLCSKGLVFRRASPDHGNARLLYLTLTGQVKADKLLVEAGHGAPAYRPLRIRRCMARDCGQTVMSEGPHHRMCDFHRRQSDNGCVADSISCGRQVGPTRQH